MFSQTEARVPTRVWLCAVLALTLTGCVSAVTHKALQRETDRVKQQLMDAQARAVEQQERMQALETRHRDLKEQTDRWQASLETTVTRLEQLAESWGQVRDDLIRLNLDQELKDLKAKDPSAKAVITLEPEREPADSAEAGAPASRANGTDKHAAIERVLEEFRTLLKE